MPHTQLVLGGFYSGKKDIWGLCSFRDSEAFRPMWSFSGRLRDERRNEHWFMSLPLARTIVGWAR